MVSRNSKYVNRNRYFKVKIIKHTPAIVHSAKVDRFHKDMVGQTVLVRKTPWDGAYFECKTGESLLKIDCEIIS